MKRFKEWVKKVCLLPMFILMGVDGDAGSGNLPADGGDGTILGGGNPPDNAADDLGALFSPEEVTAKKESLAAVKAEETRRAALTEEERTAEDAKKAEDEGKSKAPEEYADFKLPEGMPLDKELLAEFIPIAKELKLTQDQAQSLIDIQTKMMTQRMDVWSNTLKGWLDSAKTDKEIGGDGWTQNVETAQRALNTFGTPELKSALDQYGMGNHPEMIRLMTRIGKAMTEDKVVMPGTTGESAEGRIKSFYGNSDLK
jgi:hypothetical protein